MNRTQFDLSRIDAVLEHVAAGAHRTDYVIERLAAGLDLDDAPIYATEESGPDLAEQLWPGKVKFLPGKNGSWVVSRRWLVGHYPGMGWVAIDLRAGAHATVERASVGAPATDLITKVSELIGEPGVTYFVSVIERHIRDDADRAAGVRDVCLGRVRGDRTAVKAKLSRIMASARLDEMHEIAFYGSDDNGVYSIPVLVGTFTGRELLVKLIGWLELNNSNGGSR